MPPKIRLQQKISRNAIQQSNKSNKSSSVVSPSISQQNLTKIARPSKLVSKQVRKNPTILKSSQNKLSNHKNTTNKQNTNQRELFETFNINQLQQSLKYVGQYRSSHNSIKKQEPQKKNCQNNEKNKEMFEKINQNKAIQKDVNTLLPQINLPQCCKIEKRELINYDIQRLHFENSLAERQSRISILQKQIEKMNRVVTEYNSVYQPQINGKSRLTQKRSSFGISEDFRQMNKKKRTGNDDVLTESQLISINSDQISLNLTTQNLPTQIKQSQRNMFQINKQQLFAEEVTLNHKPICDLMKDQRSIESKFERNLLSQKDKNKRLQQECIQADKQIKILLSMINKSSDFASKLETDLEEQCFKNFKLKKVNKELLLEKINSIKICQTQTKILQKMKFKWDNSKHPSKLQKKAKCIKNISSQPITPLNRPLQKFYSQQMALLSARAIQF